MLSERKHTHTHTPPIGFDYMECPEKADKQQKKEKKKKKRSLPGAAWLASATRKCLHDTMNVLKKNSLTGVL